MRIFVIAILITLFSCKRDSEIGMSAALKTMFIEPNIDYPTDNMPNESRIALGRYLFYNPALSIDSSISCASCHRLDLAFSDKTILSLGANKQQGSSNSPTLTNIGFNPYFTRAGGVESLELQILVPIQEHNEFNNNIIDVGERLQSDAYFVQLAEKAYPSKPYYYSITRGLAAFERTLVSNNSKFDQYLKGKVQLSKTEMDGLLLFIGNKANCISCHTGFNFTNYNFENNGAAYILQDSGRYRITKNPRDIGLFKTPTLRNIALTAPYMHDGSIPTLKEVLLSYNNGGGKNHHQNRQLIKPLNLSQKELENMEAFLNTLSDFRFVNNPKFKKHD